MDEGIRSVESPGQGVIASRASESDGQAFFRLVPDMVDCHPWHLGKPTAPDGEVLDPRMFRYGRPVSDQTGPFSISVASPGQPVSFSFGAFDYLVVKHQLGTLLKSTAPSNVQLFPAIVEGDPSFDILNVSTQIACIDDDRTIGTKWTAEDGRPDLLGTYRGVSKLVIDASKVGDNQMFRLATRAIVLVVSQGVQQLLTTEAGPGLRFLPV